MIIVPDPKEVTFLWVDMYINRYKDTRRGGDTSLASDWKK